MPKFGVFVVYMIMIILLILLIQALDSAVYILLIPFTLLLGLFANSKIDETEKEMMEEGITGKATCKNHTAIFLANQEHIITKGKIGIEHIKGAVSFSDFDDYNNLYIMDAIDIAKRNRRDKVLNNRKETCILEALEDLQDNLSKLQLDDKDEN